MSWEIIRRKRDINKLAYQGWRRQCGRCDRGCDVAKAVIDEQGRINNDKMMDWIEFCHANCPDVAQRYHKQIFWNDLDINYQTGRLLNK